MKINRRLFILIVILVAILVLTACTAEPQSPGSGEPAVIALETTDSPVPTLEATQSPAPAAATPDGSAAKAAFRTALTDLLERHVLPDGTDCGADGISDPAGNQFAVYDMDGDGREELIAVYTTTYMAGQVAGVYGYDEGTGALYAELTEYPLLTFFSNGVVKAGWSHNQGLAGSFWPYTLYEYDQATDRYTPVGMVDAWEKAFSENDPSGNPFPDNVDTSGTGFVYYIMPYGEYALTQPVDAAAYEAWYTGYVGNAVEITVPFTALTVENIAAVQ